MAVPWWLVFLMTWIVIGGNLQTVVAQVTRQNPLIWQTLVTPTSSASYRYVANSTMKFYSQDFQTVFSYNDYFGHNERILINMGDGCNEPTYDDILYYNNGVISSFIKRQSLIGLVSRGGCSWSTKINNLQRLVQENSVLTMTGILIYDNSTYASDVAPIVTSKPSILASLSWNSSASLSPPQRNISNMQDNDIRGTNMQPFMAIYFVSRQFGLDMLSKMTNNNSEIYNSNNNIDNTYYVQLAPYFSDSVKEDNPTNGNGSDNTNSNGNIGNSGDGAFNSLFGDGNRGYIAYLVAAGVAIIMAIVLFRWCRKPRLDSSRNRENGQTTDLENQVGLQQFRQSQQNEEPPSIPIEKLNAMCPIQTADQVFTKMKNMSCCICLDDFKSSSHIRLLPCHHGFCVGCIDVWLTKKSSLCPICKHDCREAAPPAEDDNLGDLGNTMTTYHTTTTSISALPSSSSSTSLRHDVNENNNDPISTSSMITSRSPIYPLPPMEEQDIGFHQTRSSSSAPAAGEASASSLALSPTTTESSLPPPSYSSLHSQSETQTASLSELATNPRA